MDQSEGLSGKYKAMLFVGYIVAGILYQIVLIFQLYYADRTPVSNFYHPSIQLLIIFLTMAISYPIYLKKLVDGAIIEEPGKKKARIKIFIIPALLLIAVFNLYRFFYKDLIVSILNIGEGFTILFAFLFSILILKMKIKKYHKIGVPLVFIGTIIHFLAYLFFAYKRIDFDYEIIFLIIGFILNGYFYFHQHYLFEKYSIDPLQMAGTVGIVGVAATIIQIIILSYIPCDPWKDNQWYLCVGLGHEGTYLEYPRAFWETMTYSPVNFFLAFISFPIAFVYTQLSLRITKYYGGLSNTIMIAAQMPAFQMLIIIIGGYFRVDFILTIVASSIFIIGGAIVYFKNDNHSQTYQTRAEILTEETNSIRPDEGRVRLIVNNS